jgi:hypothetical protein
MYRAIHVRRPSAITGSSDEPALAKLIADPWFSTIPEDVRHEIERMTYTKTHHLKIGERNIRVVLVQHSPSLAFCKRAIDKIERWLSFILSIAPAKCANSLAIYVCFTEHKKVLPSNIGALYNGGDKSSHPDVRSVSPELVGQIHANTAFTTSCSRENTIFIYRKEEWFKVLIHESFHCLGLDFSELRSDSPDNVIRSAFPALSPNVDVRLYETYCEMWAEIINVLFLCGPATIRCKSVRYAHLSKTRTQKEVSRAAGFNCVARLLKYERMYSVFQANKLLRHYGLSYADLFDKTRVYQEKTQAFSYYVLKSILMWNLDAFMQWCLANNPTPYSLEFAKPKVVAYARMLQSNSRDASYMDAMREIGGIERCGKTLATTMRMCLFEGY